MVRFFCAISPLFASISVFSEKRRGGTNGTPNRSSRAAGFHTTKRRKNSPDGGAYQMPNHERHNGNIEGAARFGRDERDGAARFTIAHNYHFVILAAHGWRIVHGVPTLTGRKYTLRGFTLLQTSMITGLMSKMFQLYRR